MRLHNLSHFDLDGWAKVPFRDNDELVAAMQDPRYKSNTGGDAYRAAVATKLALAITDSSGHGTDHESYRPVLDAEPTYRAVGLNTTVHNEFTGQRDLTAEAERRAEHEAAVRALGAAMGPQAIQPSTEVAGEGLMFNGLPVDV